MTTFDALAGAIVGSLLTALLWFGRYLYLDRRRGQQLESSIHTELSHMDVFDNLDQIPKDKFPDPSAFPTFIFESNTDKLALLPQEYRHSVHAFYTYLETTKAMMEQEIRNQNRNMKVRKQIRHNLDSLRQRREILLEELSE